MQNTTKLLEAFNVGTTVYYNGDDVNDGGYGKITNTVGDYSGELELEITLDDGRQLYNVTPADFEPRFVGKEVGMPEFVITDEYEQELDGWDEIEEEVGYSQENSVMMNLAY